MKEAADLTPLVLGLLAALTVALCAADIGAKILTLLTRRPRHERRRGTGATTSRA